MIDELTKIAKHQLRSLLQDQTKWQGIVIDRRKPITYRAWTMIGTKRLCLHKFEYIDKDSGEEAFMHPHPWSGGFYIVDGSYAMKLGYTSDRISNEPIGISLIHLSPGSKYEITSPLVWHSVTPLTETVYTIMLNDEPWPADVAHTSVRTTKGKGLREMTKKELADHLLWFNYNLPLG